MNARFALPIAAAAGLAVVFTAAAQEPAPPTAAPRADIEVTVRHLDGQVEQFSKDVAALEIVVAPGGEMRYVHLVLISGAEKDTHLWYNYGNLASLRYRFLHITGKGKVAVRQLKPFETQERPGLKPKVPLLDADDYK